MKVGFLFECSREGPDVQVYRTLIGRLMEAGEIGTIEVVPITLDNLPKLKAGCGEAASTALATGCDRVVVCWDLYPTHDRSIPNCVEQRAEIEANLRAAGVNMNLVHFVCIRRELEAWLIVDGNAIKNLRRSSQGRAPSFNHCNAPDDHPDPKGYLMTLWKTELKQGKFQPHYHAVSIAKGIELRRLAASQSFCHLVRRLRRLSPGSSPTICL